MPLWKFQECPFLHNLLWKALVGFSEKHLHRSKLFTIRFKRVLWLSYTEVWCVNNTKGWLYDFLLWRINLVTLNETNKLETTEVIPWILKSPLFHTTFPVIHNWIDCFVLCILFQFFLFLLKQIKLNWGRFICYCLLKSPNFCAGSVCNVSNKYKLYGQIWHVNFYP